VVDYDTDIAAAEIPKQIQTTVTKVIEITVSRLDCFLGLFRKGKRTHAATIEIEVMKDDETKVRLFRQWIQI
jgi:hypothetical protein